MSSARVAISGLGVISPGAIGTAAFRELLYSGRSAVAPIDRFDTEGLRSHRAALLTEFKPKDFLNPMKMRRMNNLSRMALSAAKLSMRESGIEKLPYERSEVAVALGTCFGPVQTSVEYLQEYVEKGAALAPPQLFAESVANAPGSHIAIEYGFENFNLTFTQRESSVLSALLYGASQIVKGSARAVIGGGVEEMNEILFAVLDRIGALAHANGEVDEACRPFDRRRNGIAVGEGAATFILEADPHLGAPLGYLSGFGIGKDVSASVSNWGTDSRPVVTAMRAALDDAEIKLEDISAIWASANGSVLGDRVEYEAIQSLYDGASPPVVATKGVFGEYAAGGGLHFASALIGLHEQRLPRSVGFAEPEAGMSLPVTRESADCKLDHILINSLSAGGGIISAVLSREAG